MVRRTFYFAIKCRSEFTNANIVPRHFCALLHSWCSHILWYQWRPLHNHSSISHGFHALQHISAGKRASTICSDVIRRWITYRLNEIIYIEWPQTLHYFPLSNTKWTKQTHSGDGFLTFGSINRSQQWWKTWTIFYHAYVLLEDMV